MASKYDIAAIPLKIVIVGHVDHGKSTLVGRLFHDTGSLPEGKVEAIMEMCERRGMPFEWAFMMDALKAERDQGITIDTAHIQFHTDKRKYLLIDAPGHREFLKNMISGAAAAEAAVLVVDAKEGVQEQTRRHGYLLHLLGINQVAVAVNKMDLVDHSEKRFQEVSAEVRAYLKSIGVDTAQVQVIPVSARDGDNIANVSENMLWYQGSTISEALDSFRNPVLPVDMDLRLPVQDVYKFDERRIIAGRIESGQLNVGDELLFTPSNKRSRVKSLEWFNSPEPVMAARAGQSVGITLEDQIFVERGDVASHVSQPPMMSNVFRARIFWMGHVPLETGNAYKMKLNTGEYQVVVDRIERVIDVQDLSGSEAERVDRNAVAEVILRSRTIMPVDEFVTNQRTGRFVLVEDHDIVGGGLVSMEGYADQRPALGIKSTNVFRVEHSIPLEERWLVNRHRSGIMWFTGLSGSGKSTLAFLLEQALFKKGYQVYVLDGDNIRHGLSADLGFSPEDRQENIRRVGEAAGLFARAGFIVITSFISPYRADRDSVRAIAPDMFHEIHIDADLETCESRDPKGLYQKARKGEIAEFTGISAPYEPPEDPELVVDTAELNVEQCVERLLDYVAERFGMTQEKAVQAAAK